MSEEPEKSRGHNPVQPPTASSERPALFHFRRLSMRTRKKPYQPKQVMNSHKQVFSTSKRLAKVSRASMKVLEKQLYMVTSIFYVICYWLP